MTEREYQEFCEAFASRFNDDVDVYEEHELLWGADDAPDYCAPTYCYNR